MFATIDQRSQGLRDRGRWSAGFHTRRESSAASSFSPYPRTLHSARSVSLSALRPGGRESLESMRSRRSLADDTYFCGARVRVAGDSLPLSNALEESPAAPRPFAP